VTLPAIGMVAARMATALVPAGRALTSLTLPLDMAAPGRDDGGIGATPGRCRSQNPRRGVQDEERERD